MKHDGFYIHRGERIPIVINNDGSNLSFKMYDTIFSGTEFSDFSIQKNYLDEIKQKCDFWEVEVLNSGEKELMLCNCIFEIYIPQVIIEDITLQESAVLLRIDYMLGKERPKPKGGLDKEYVKLSIQLDGDIYAGEGSFFEDAFNELSLRLGNAYYFKNCYGCLFSDYSIYGQSSFGTMQCHIDNKEEYLKANNKIAFSELDRYQYVQEIYVCNKYKQRNIGTGYRG